MASAAKTKKKIRTSQGVFPALFGGGRNSDMSLSLFAYIMILLVVGIVMMASASYAWAYSEWGDGLYYAKNQVKNAIIGFIAMIFFMNFDYHNFKKMELPFLKKINIASVFYVTAAVLLVAVLLIGNTEGGDMGAKRWITIGGIDLQPSEIAKLALIVFLAYSMERDGKKMNNFKTGIIKYAGLLLVYVVLILLEKHISAIALLCTIAIALILCGGANLKQLCLLGVSAVVAIASYIIWQANVPGSYVQVRLKSFRRRSERYMANRKFADSHRFGRIIRAWSGKFPSEIPLSSGIEERLCFPDSLRGDRFYRRACHHYSILPSCC